ncbi:DNA nucleotidylexotransferase-like isoform X3 [Stylophora pistillata]|uniref:DNA nucleotidylexotransferase-like isoform X3 n=1 Tax=Stylophora pistillata TaxID=50429 RepID=UPI000C03A12A|nr:DNA nucleotidylexotransferase-like isoform X3 [Stylophora pistillata]
MEAKRFKIDQDNNGKVQRDSERTTATKLAETLIYIVPKKIPKARLQVLSNLAQKKGFPLSERFSDSVTHIVTAYDTVEKIHAFLERQPARNVEVVSLYWLTDCITEGKIVNVTDKVRIKSGGELTSQKSCGVAEAESSKLEETSFGEYQVAQCYDFLIHILVVSLLSSNILFDIPIELFSICRFCIFSLQDTKFVCQRATPLIHHNTKFTNALEILERHAVYVDSSQRDSRALAFRRAACALKSYPKYDRSLELKRHPN